MILHSLDVKNFRAITHMSVAFDDTGVTLIDGGNESGKTSLVDAFAFLLSAKSTSQGQAARRNQREGTHQPVEITAEFTIDGERIRYAKVFRRSGSGVKESTELSYIHPAKPGLSGEAAHKHVEALLGGKPETSLWNKLRVTQEEQTTQLSDVAGIGPLKRALDAQAGDSTPSDDDSLYTAVAARRNKYFGKSGTPIGGYSALINSEQELRKETEQAASEAEALTASIRSLSDLGKRLERKSGLVEDAEIALKVAQAATAELREITGEYDTWDHKQRLGAAQVANAKNAQQRRKEIQAQLTEAKSAAENLRAREEEHLEEARERVADIDKLEAAQREADEAAQHAGTVVGAAQKKLDLLTVIQEKRRLELRQRRNRELVTQISELQASLDANNISDEQIRQLREAHNNARTLTAAVHAATSRIVISGSGRATVNEDDVDAGAGWEGYVDSSTTIRVDDVTVEISPPADAVEARENAQRAEQQLSELLAALGVDDLDAAESRRDTARDTKERLAGLRGELDALWGKDSASANDVEINRLRDQEKALRKDLGDATGTVDTVFEAEASNSAQPEQAATPIDTAAFNAAVETLREELTAAEKAFQQARTVAQRASSARDAAHNSIGQDQLKLKLLSQQREEQQQAVDKYQEALASARADSSDAELDAAVVAAENSLSTLEQDAESLKTKLAAAQLKAEKHNEKTAEEALARHRDEYREMDSKYVSLKSQIETLSSQGLASTAEEKQAELQRLQARLNAEQRRAEAARLLFDTLDAKRDEAIARYAEPLRAELAKLGKRVFGEDFDVKLNEDLKVDARVLDGTWVPFDALSGGAKEQFGLLTRIVSATLAAGGIAPIFLDDTLGFTDPDRREAMARIITEVGKHNQIIVLTCDEERFKHLGSVQRYTMSTMSSVPPAAATPTER